VTTKRKVQPKPLDKSEWAFHKLDDDEIPSAGRWELDRHRGIQLVPYLDSDWHQIRQQLREFRTSKKKCPFLACPLRARRRVTETPNEGSSWHEGEFFLDLTFTVDEIVASFREWLTTNMHERIRKHRPGKSISYWKSVLVDIAMYRADEAGYTRPQAFELLRPIFDRFGLVPKDFRLSRPSPKKVRPKDEKAHQGKLSREHWSRSLAKARRLMGS
jgi:hypothetical protein